MGTEEIGGGESPPPSATIGGPKDLRSKQMGAGKGEGRLKIRVWRPEFLSSSSAETSMSYGKVRKMAGEDRRSKSPRVLSANFHSHQPLRSMEGRGNRFPQLGNRPPRATFAPKRPTEGRKLLRGLTSEVLQLRLVAILAHRQTRRCGGGDGLEFSIGRRLLGSAPIENPRPSSDLGQRPASLGWVKRSEGRAPTERRAELGRGARGGR